MLWSDASSQPTTLRRPDHSRAPAPSSQNIRECRRAIATATASGSTHLIGPPPSSCQPVFAPQGKYRLTTPQILLGGSRGTGQEVVDQSPTVLGEHRLGMELHARLRPGAMPYRHDDTIVATRRDLQLVR